MGGSSEAESSAVHCIIGAGYCGLATARAYRHAGLPYVQLEASDRLGGVWAHRTYDSLHMVTSKASTAYLGDAMPEEYPDFPSAAQMLAYLEAVADRHGLADHIEFGTEVVAVRPIDSDGRAGWTVELATGEVRTYASVVVASGQYRDPHIPTYPGRFSGLATHSSAYKNAADLDGPRVLVVGAGNSACDVATDAARAFGTADISVRNGAWFVPKSLLGIPVSDLDRWWTPTLIGKTMLRAGVRIALGSPERYGLPKPRHDILAREVTINSDLLHALRHGRVKARHAIDRLDGTTVHFSDSTSDDYDTIVWATGYRLGLPFLDDQLLTWHDGAPRLIAHVLAPGLANLAILGLVRPRTGAGPIVGAATTVLAKITQLQPKLAVPFSDVLGRVVRADHELTAGTRELRGDLATAGLAVRVLNRHPRLAERVAGVHAPSHAHLALQP